MNLNKMFVFIFVFFLVFSALLVTMPAALQEMGIEADIQDKEVREYFTVHDVTMYNYTYAIDPLDYGVYNQSTFGLPGSQLIEFQFDYGALRILHLTDNLWGWWWGWHVLRVYEPYRTTAGLAEGYDSLNKANLLALWNEDYNASYYECGCTHVAIKMFVMTSNQAWTLSESWDHGELKIFTSYEIDWEATSVSMWNIMMQLLSFQNPELGIPGIFGTILTVGFGGALWACIAILAFALITSVIPTISGWRGD